VLAVVVLDQLTKMWVVSSMRLHESVPLIDGLLSLTYVRNTGAAFSLLAGAPEAFRVPFFLTVASVAIVAIGLFLWNTPASHRLTLVALALVLGGAAGNLIDRLTYGEVIDFVDVYWGDWHWPAFNVADSGSRSAWSGCSTAPSATEAA
jgi:signal peptidase II